MDINNIQVVEYSVNQGCYHLHSLAEMLIKNTEAVMSDRSSDYIVIGFFRTDSEADNFIEWHRSKMKLLKSSKRMVANKNKSVFVKLP